MRTKSLGIAVMMLVSQIAFPGAMGKVPKITPPIAQPMIAITLGPSFTNVGETQDVYLESETTVNTYKANKNLDTMLFGELFVGWQKFLNMPLTGQLGLALVGVGNAKPSGEIWRQTDLNLNDYVYSYKIRHTHLAVKGKLIGNYPIQPYLSASVGLGDNYASDFIASPKYSTTPIQDFNFIAHHSLTITYALGVGLQKMISPHLQIGLGYEVANWGTSRLNPSLNQLSNDGLVIRHIIASQAQVNISFIL